MMSLSGIISHHLQIRYLFDHRLRSSYNVTQDNYRRALIKAPGVCYPEGICVMRINEMGELGV